MQCTLWRIYCILSLVCTRGLSDLHLLNANEVPYHCSNQIPLPQKHIIKIFLSLYFPISGPLIEAYLPIFKGSIWTIYLHEYFPVISVTIILSFLQHLTTFKVCIYSEVIKSVCSVISLSAFLSQTPTVSLGTSSTMSVFLFSHLWKVN